MQPIVLYDLANTQPPERRAISGNTWKARLALNYKGLPLTTEWVDPPDVEALYHKLGVAPAVTRPDGTPYCSLPLIYDPSTRTHISDSYQIALYLDRTYPATPPLFPPGTHAFHALFQSTATALATSALRLRVAAFCSLLSARAQARFRPRNEQAFGAPLESLCDEAQWAEAERVWAGFAAALDANGAGREGLVMGDRVCFADLQVAAMLAAARNTLGPESEGWRRMCGWQGGRWERFLERFAQYTVMDV